jgi:transposase-like protein
VSNCAENLPVFTREKVPNLNSNNCYLVVKGLCLNNLLEQDHRFINKITKPMMGFKAFHSAKAALDGIETAHMIRKGQLISSLWL